MNLIPYELFPVPTTAYEVLLTKLWQYELLVTKLWQYELFPLRAFAYETFVYELNLFELFGYEPNPIRTFYTMNFCRYELLNIRALSQTNICIGTVAYEPFPTRVLCLRTLVRGACCTCRLSTIVIVSKICNKMNP